jgi:hypothetical protein
VARLDRAQPASMVEAPAAAAVLAATPQPLSKTARQKAAG